MKETCYMCSNPATSKEHVPPLCLFPESKDTFGHNFRKDLITVPSCDLHNSKKSKDDEFLMVSIACIVGNNFLGYYHTNTKISRALRRKSESFLYKEVIKNAKPENFKIGNKTFPGLRGLPNVSRLLECFKHIALGLYYYENKRRFKGIIKVILGFVDYKKEDDQTFVKFLRKRFELEERLLEEKGKNKKVFTYQFCKPDEYGIIGLKLMFYGYTDVFFAFVPDNMKEQPYHLGVDLMKNGIPTTFKLGDEEFHFNTKKDE